MPSPARQSFLDRLEAFARAVHEPSVRHTGPVSSPNDPARLLRNGLAVTGFNLLEDFVRLRTIELLNHVSRSALNFSQLPEKLQRAATENVVSALPLQIRLARQSGGYPAVRSLIGATGEELASTRRHPYQLSPLSFAHGTSNVDPDQVAEICRGLGVAEGWPSIRDSTASIGISLPNPASSYRDASLRRHAAAHVAAHDTPQGDLKAYVPEALAIACAFDMLVSRAAFHLRTSDLAGLPVPSSSVGVTFVDDEPQLTHGARLSSAQAAAQASGDVLVYRRGGQPYGWHTSDLEAGRP